MDGIINDFVAAHHSQIGYLLACTISPEAPPHDPSRLYALRHNGNEMTIATNFSYRLQYVPGLTLSKEELKVWQEIYVNYAKFVMRLLAAEEASTTGSVWPEVYNAWKLVVNSLLKGYSESVLEAWTLPCLYIAGKYLRVFAIKADDAATALRERGIIVETLQDDDASDGSGNQQHLEDAARQINRIFSICNGDRNPIEISRKWALYYVACLLFKTYFRLSSMSLCKNILRSLVASTDLPPLSSFPKSHQVTFNYYAGVIQFLEEDYAQAEKYLEEAYSSCSSKASHNIELILTYLIPTKMITKHQLPRPALLAPYPRLGALFTPIITAVKKGDLSGLDAALAEGEAEFVKRRIYLTLERARDVAVRNLFRMVYLAAGFEPPKDGETVASRRTRLPLAEFSAALLLAGAEVEDGNGGVDSDEVECMIANMIYKNMMKGYIARDRGFVVLSKADAFPGTGI